MLCMQGEYLKKKGLRTYAWNGQFKWFDYLIGEGPQKEDLEKVTQVKKLSFGQMDNDKLLNILACNSCYCNKLYEGQPRLLCEALSVELFHLPFIWWNE